MFGPQQARLPIYTYVPQAVLPPHAIRSIVPGTEAIGIHQPPSHWPNGAVANTGEKEGRCFDLLVTSGVGEMKILVWLGLAWFVVVCDDGRLGVDHWLARRSR